MFKVDLGLVYMKIDLHMHSTASDGKLSPRELVDWAVKREIPAIAITDHEVVDGSREAVGYAKGKSVEVVSGIEIGADDNTLKIYDVHIVGLFLDLENKELLELSKKLMRAREVQKKEIIERLNELGYEITFEELKKEAGGINYGRPHIARILMRKYDEFENMQDVFDKLLGDSGDAYVRQWKDTIENTVDIIHGAGGVAILAHPMFYENVENVVEGFVEAGGDGIEVDYPYEARFDKERAREMRDVVRGFVERYGLVVSGGGDFHFKDGFCEIGDYGLSVVELERLKEFRKK